MCISFPPLTGFTTLITLAGFAYGMQGFFISAVASVFGSALVFIILRRLFSHKLHAWSSQSEKWQALEAVIVSYISSILKSSSNSETIFIEGEGFAINYSYSSFALPAMGLFQFFICSKPSVLFFSNRVSDYYPSP